MISLEAFLNAYIDANIILALGAVIWAAAQLIIRRTSLKRAHGAQLNLLYGVLIIVGVAPFAALALWPQAQALNLNLSDMIVAEYLDGRFAMAPTTFEALLASRDTLILEVTTLGTTTGTMIAAILTTGITFAALRTLVNLTRVRRVIAQSYLWRQSGRVQIRLTDVSSIPFSTRGMRQHYVVIPSEMLATPADLRIALSHEFQHLRQGDLSWETMLELLRPLFVFNPAMRYWKLQVERQRELACDQQVMQRKSLSAQDYANCLLRVCTNAVHRQSHATIPAVALVQARGRRNAQFLRHRVLQMIEGSAGPTRRWVVPALLVPLALSVALSAIAIQRSGDWSQDRLMLSTIVNLERLNQRNGY